jgi:hypothetical protein
MGTDDAVLALSGVFLLAGITLVIFATRELRQLRRLRERGVRVPGTVVEFKSVRIGDGEELRPLLRYSTVDGRVIESVSRLSPGPLRGQEHPGQPVSVVYDPANPASSIAGGVPRDAGCNGTLLVAIGVMFVLGSLLFMSIGLAIR